MTASTIAEATMTVQEPGRLTLTIPECAEALGIGRNTAYELVAQGKLPVLRLGRRLVVPKAALEKLLAEAGQHAAAKR